MRVDEPRQHGPAAEVNNGLGLKPLKLVVEPDDPTLPDGQPARPWPAIVDRVDVCIGDDQVSSDVAPLMTVEPRQRSDMRPDVAIPPGPRAPEIARHRSLLASSTACGIGTPQVDPADWELRP